MMSIKSLLLIGNKHALGTRDVPIVKSFGLMVSSVWGTGARAGPRLYHESTAPGKSM